MQAAYVSEPKFFNPGGEGGMIMQPPPFPYRPLRSSMVVGRCLGPWAAWRLRPWDTGTGEIYPSVLLARSAGEAPVTRYYWEWEVHLGSPLFLMTYPPPYLLASPGTRLSPGPSPPEPVRRTSASRTRCHLSRSLSSWRYHLPPPRASGPTHHLRRSLTLVSAAPES